MTAEKIQDAVLTVIGLQFHSDLLPEAGPLWGQGSLTEAGHLIASFVVYRIGPENAEEAARLLLELAQDRDGPLVDALTQVSLLEWRHERSPWLELQEVLRATAQVLLATYRAVGPR